MIEVKNLTIQDEDEQYLVDDVSFHINRGEFVALFGEDAEARKEILHCIMGYKMYYIGRAGFSEDVMCVRYLPDDILLEEEMTVAEYFNMVSSRYDRYNVSRQEQLCEKFEIDTEEKLLEMTFEGNKLVQFISMICCGPDVIIVDELHRYISPKIMMMILGILKKFNEIGVTILYSCTNYETIKSVCNRYIMLDDAQIVADNYDENKEVRKRIITVEGGKSERLENIFGEYIATKNNRSSYVCNQPPDKTLLILYKLGSKDYLIEEMTLAEELTNDYSRWKDL